MLDKFFKKEKPIFTGYRFGFGSSSGPAAPQPYETVQVLFASFADATHRSTSQEQIASSVKVLDENIKYIYVCGTAGGGAGARITGSDIGNAAGAGAGSINKVTGFELDASQIGTPIQVKVGYGGLGNAPNGSDGGDTEVIIDSTTVITMTGGTGGQGTSPTSPTQPGGSTTIHPSISRLGPFPANNLCTGGLGGGGGRSPYHPPGKSGDTGGTAPNNRGCAGGGGGGSHFNGSGGSGGSSNHPNNSGSASFTVEGPSAVIASQTYTGSFPITISGSPGGGAGSGGPGTSPGGDKLLAQGGAGNGQDSNSGGAGGAGGGLKFATPALPAPDTYFHGGGGGGCKSYMGGPTEAPVVKAAGGGGCVIVIGSSRILSI